MKRTAVDVRTTRRRLARRGGLVGCAIAVMALSAPLGLAAGQPAPTPATNVSSVENEPVHYHSGANGVASHDAANPVTPNVSAVGDLTHVILALGIVIGIIFGLRWVARRFSLVPSMGKSSRGVRLLSRTILSPKQQVLLLQVGRRVVVVGDGGAAGMRALCEITDPDEVASLIGDAKATDAMAAGPRSFGNLFRRASEPFDAGEETPALAPPPGSDAEVPSDVVGLLDKVRGLRQQFER